MTNHFLPSRFVEVVQTLAIGIEPVDACRGARIPPPLFMLRDVKITAEQRVRLRDERRYVTELLPRVGRTRTCRFRLLYDEVDVHVSDPWARVRLLQGFTDSAPRQFVPRRLELPLMVEGAAEAEPMAKRIHRPALFPGADYPVHDSVTGVRGRIVRAGRPMPWGRVEARRVSNGVVGGTVVGRAHGDDRGEFLLLLQGTAAAPGGASMALTVRLFVYGPAPAPVAVSAIDAAIDPQWSLPLERLPLTAAISDPVSRGDDLPPHYTAMTSREVTLRLGVVASEQNPFVIT